MSRIRTVRLSRREALLSKAECADTLDHAAGEVEREAERGRFDLASGYGAAREIVDAFRATAPGYLRRSRLRSKGAKR